MNKRVDHARTASRSSPSAPASPSPASGSISAPRSAASICGSRSRTTRIRCDRGGAGRARADHLPRPGHYVRESDGFRPPLRRTHRASVRAATTSKAPELIKFRNDETDAAVRHRRVAFRRDVPRRAADGDDPVRQGGAGGRRRHHVRQHVGGVRRPERPHAAVHLRARGDPRLQAVPGAVRQERGGAQEAAAASSCMYPPQLHPVVRVHPVSGRKVLFVNPQFTIAIKGMDERESRALLDTLFHQALIPEYQFRHHWAPHTIAMWDNRSTQHYAVHDYYPQRRYMERVTIKGGPVTGVAARRPGDHPQGEDTWRRRASTRTAATSRIRPRNRSGRCHGPCRGRPSWPPITAPQTMLPRRRAPTRGAPTRARLLRHHPPNSMTYRPPL